MQYYSKSTKGRQNVAEIINLLRSIFPNTHIFVQEFIPKSRQAFGEATPLPVSIAYSANLSLSETS